MDQDTVDLVRGIEIIDNLIECSANISERATWEKNIRPRLAEGKTPSTNIAMVPCEAHIGAGRECVVLSGRTCNDYPCRIMAHNRCKKCSAL